MPETATQADNRVRSTRYRQAALLLDKWASEDPAYDERAGAALDLELNGAAMRCEEKDDSPA
jgi:hypothetical protein